MRFMLEYLLQDSFLPNFQIPTNNFSVIVAQFGMTP